MRKGTFINEKDVKFIVKEEERKVLCILNETALDALDIIDHMSHFFLEIGDKSYIMPNKFVGIATCAPDDTWDEKVGRVIAFNKVCEKYYKSLFKRLNTYVQDADYELNRSINEFNTYGERVGKMLDTEKNYLNKLIGVEEKS